MTDDLLAMAYVQASFSHDPSSQNGAVLVDYDRVVARGFNHVPFKEGEELEAILRNKEEKYAHVIHAEVDAIAHAASRKVRTYDLTMVCPWAACTSCAAVILQSGIDRLIVHKQRMELTHEPWISKVESALRWLRSKGIVVEFFDGPVPNAPNILVNGRWWSPATGQFVT